MPPYVTCKEFDTYFWTDKAPPLGQVEQKPLMEPGEVMPTWLLALRVEEGLEPRSKLAQSWMTGHTAQRITMLSPGAQERVYRKIQGVGSRAGVPLARADVEEAVEEKAKVVEPEKKKSALPWLVAAAAGALALTGGG